MDGSDEGVQFTRDGRPCKACYSFEDMVRMASRQVGAKERRQRQANPQSQQQQQQQQQQNAAAENGHNATTIASGQRQQQNNSMDEEDLDGSRRRRDCPVDKDQLGRSTWDLLHTISVYYPDKPTEQEKRDVQDMLASLSKTYPCEHCAADLRDDLKRHPPAVQSRSTFALWMCDMHNRVNIKLGKQLFDCDRVMERWYDGWKDGSCDS